MPPEFEGTFEHHIRVVFHLPCSDNAEAKVIKRFVAYLESQHQKPFALRGYTHSTATNRTFTGYWRPSTRAPANAKNKVSFPTLRESYSRPATPIFVQSRANSLRSRTPSKTPAKVVRVGAVTAYPILHRVS